MPHLVLLGDASFDNGAYVAGGPDVVAQLGAALPAGWRTTRTAADGADIADVRRQLTLAPDDASHLVVSVGGTDALGHADLLSRRAESSPQVLGWMADAAEAFEARYRAMLDDVLAHGAAVVLCTVYNGNFARPQARLAATALTVFDDAILRLAAERALSVVELRLVCREPADYATPLAPSMRGGEKMARAIARATGAGPAGGAVARVFTGWRQATAPATGVGIGPSP